MKRLDTTQTGGQPLESDDLGFLQDNIITAMGGLISTYLPVDTTTGYILSGCIQSDGGATFDYTSGFVYFSGEVFRFDAINVTKPAAGQKQVFNIVDIDGLEAAAIKTFEDLSSKNVYRNRSVEIINVLTSDARVAYDANANLNQIITDSTVNTLNYETFETQIRQYLNNGVIVTTATMLNGWTDESGTTPFRIVKDPFGRVSFEGQLKRSVATSDEAFAVPYTTLTNQSSIWEA